MSDGAFQIKKMVPIIVLTWILSLVTTLAVVYVAPSIFPISVSTDNISDEARARRKRICLPLGSSAACGGECF